MFDWLKSVGQTVVDWLSIGSLVLAAIAGLLTSVCLVLAVLLFVGLTFLVLAVGVPVVLLCALPAMLFGSSDVKDIWNQITRL